ncbi:MAG: HAD-IA family hydrolase [Lactobacillaceae bacterium]|nr:HAD-IA family hydrolase [Lactobacillaceae bacterium]
MKHIRNLVFDLDGTLYPETDEIKQRFLDKMVEYFRDEMGIIADDYMVLIAEWRKKHGSCTPAVAEYGGDPKAYMNYAGDVDVSDVEYNDELKKKLERLSHRKIIYTNGSMKHTIDVLERLRLNGMFDELYTIGEADYVPKPNMASYKMLLEKYNLNPDETVLIEDRVKNLQPAKELGIKTVLITDGGEKDVSFCDYIVKDIIEAVDLFLEQ